MHLRPVGEVDLGTVPILWSNLKAMLEDNLNVIVDLKGIQDIDSTGIKALLDAHQLFIQRGQRFVVSEPNAICRKLFGITGLIKPSQSSSLLPRRWPRSAFLPSCRPAQDSELYTRQRIAEQYKGGATGMKIHRGRIAQHRHDQLLREYQSSQARPRGSAGGPGTGGRSAGSGNRAGPGGAS